MQYYVYYRAWPHKNLRAIQAEADTSELAVASVAQLLKDENELHFKPLIAVLLGGKI